MGGQGSGRKKSMLNIYKGSSHSFTRPEGAGNFDNMDDLNIVHSINTRQGTIDHTPTQPKDIANKAYVDSVVVGGGESDPIWLAQSGGYIKTGEETDPVFLALSGAFLTAESDPVWLAQSGSYLKTVDNDDGWLLQSGAWNTHVADNSQAHSDYLINNGDDSTSGKLSISTDQDASGAAFFRNILIGTEDTPGAASGWTQGTIYLQYTA